MARCGENTGQHACEQIDDGQQVSEGGHFMELLVSQIIIRAELWTVHYGLCISTQRAISLA